MKLLLYYHLRCDNNFNNQIFQVMLNIVKSGSHCWLPPRIRVLVLDPFCEVSKTVVYHLNSVG